MTPLQHLIIIYVCMLGLFLQPLFAFFTTTKTMTNAQFNPLPRTTRYVQGRRPSSICRRITVRDFLQDLTDSKIGQVRFVVQGTGAILETVGSFDNLRYAETPKGTLATVSTTAPCFECHLKIDSIDSVQQVVIEKFGKTLRVFRFCGKDVSNTQTTFLSAILHEVYLL